LNASDTQTKKPPVYRSILTRTFVQSGKHGNPIYLHLNMGSKA